MKSPACLILVCLCLLGLGQETPGQTLPGPEHIVEDILFDNVSSSEGLDIDQARYEFDGDIYRVGP